MKTSFLNLACHVLQSMSLESMAGQNLSLPRHYSPNQLENTEPPTSTRNRDAPLEENENVACVDGTCKSTSCFVAGTLVQTESGGVPIESLEVGDVVLARHEKTGELGYHSVINTIVHLEQPLLRLRVLVNHRESELEVTGEHPFFTLDEPRNLTRGAYGARKVDGGKKPSRWRSIGKFQRERDRGAFACITSRTTNGVQPDRPRRSYLFCGGRTSLGAQSMWTFYCGRWLSKYGV